MPPNVILSAYIPYGQNEKPLYEKFPTVSAVTLLVVVFLCAAFLFWLFKNRRR